MSPEGPPGSRGEPFEAIRTPRLELRPLTAGTARDLADGDYSGVPAGADWPTEATPIVAMRAAVDPGALTWLIARRGMVIGECGLKHAPGPDGSAEIGYGMGAAWRANGYGTEAVGALVEWLPNLAGCRRVTAEVHETNLASRRLLERLSFTIDHLASPYVWYSRVLSHDL
ncbi:GNAT family N-acetyltransferase [Actinoallomurus iriomotensis]|uniref:N-acetyltransferase n=1 Tax=Actinoallomurus iriomotensis TaxID=478107 RepID=A0A9W6RQA6_9ACTN|nr:GNAT family N-acetyltransferase [Actinoallomurus iriomotensis]GLY78207.1 N-acetyltransferase [Actinoallomurus iriomotensis]